MIKNILIAFVFIFVSCGQSNTIEKNRIPKVVSKPKFKYWITYSFGNKTTYDVSTGDIIYLEGGRIKYESFNNGHPDTVIVGGTYLIENYNNN